MNLIEETIAGIEPLDAGAADLARSRQATLTKPAGALGRLEELSIQLAAITGSPRPRFERKAVIVLAADHGVTAEGVSAYPSAVTPQMVANFLAGGAAINVLARQAGARVTVVDVGVAGPIPGLDQSASSASAPVSEDARQVRTRFVSHRVAAGTRNFAAEPAMTREQAWRAVETGIEALEAEVERGLDLVATGEMGIGNTSAATAIVAALCRVPVPLVTGRGTGLDDAGLAHKARVIAAALDRHLPDPQDPIDVLSKVGGFEIGAIAGVVLAAARRRIPVVSDGFISGAGALLAVSLAPPCREFLIAGHRSVESGHAVTLERLGLHPLLDLQLRLGEGTGAVLAFHLVDAAARILDEMATFADAGVAGRTTEEDELSPQSGRASIES
ncbi:MAG: nicotinate-nucleotide--dimethylbenzimidazole phosphoribosyltransferase [Chloroflexi bacterium]|nr:nicotinate-nucleotide--dimethylbenzimidazole phosphoribosyltransferase [Chloroflexota bacterium]